MHNIFYKKNIFIILQSSRLFLQMLGIVAQNGFSHIWCPGLNRPILPNLSLFSLHHTFKPHKIPQFGMPVVPLAPYLKKIHHILYLRNEFNKATPKIKKTKSQMLKIIFKEMFTFLIDASLKMQGEIGSVKINLWK